MTITARAANVVEGNADRRVGIAALHSQIEIDDGVAGVARDDEPVMLRRKRSAYCRPEPRGFLRGQAGVELSDNSERILVVFALPAHAFEVFMDFVVARVVAHEAMLGFGGTLLKTSVQEPGTFNKAREF